MHIKGLLIRPDGIIKKVKFSSYERIQKAVGGFYEELPFNKVLIKGKELILADEEGALKGKPLNQIGTYIVGQPVVGNVVIIGEGVDETGEVDYQSLELERINELFESLIR